ncbi:MAG: MCE family protein [Marmoricola sp.]
MTTSIPRSASLTRRTSTVLCALLSSLLVLSGCASSVYDVPLPGGASTGENPMKITVMFRDVLDLVPQTTVKVDDVTVGKVKTIKLKGYVAKVSIELRRNVNLPDNARAEIRQTSLLGEKFVSLSPPQQPGSGTLGDGDTIGLDRTGRNPEVEEVLGALSLLLNGGGVGQLKTIFSELNNALDGRESQVRSVLDQIRSFMSQLDQNKESVVAAIENTNRLAGELKKQDTTIKSALDHVPATLRSVNRQRDDLVKLLQALDRLSGVGVRVIRASKESTINSLRSLAPVLEGFAKAGDSFPKSFQVFLTYPFVDAAIGRDPQVARNLHMGDYTNLSVNLDIGLATLPSLPTLPGCETLAQILDDTRDNVKTAADQVVAALPDNPLITNAEKQKLRDTLVNKLLKPALAQAKKQCNAPDVAGLVTAATKLVPNLLDVLNILTPAQVKQLIAGTLGTVGGALGGLGGATGGGGGVGGGLPVLPRPAPGRQSTSTPLALDPFGLATRGLDPGIGTMLLQGVAEVR